jgi:UDP-N-acetylglucosamine acyltransferase
METAVHSTAVVHPKAKVGQGASIGPYCVVGEEVAIGDGARLLSHVVVDGRTTIGAACVISPMASVGGAPQDLKYDGEPTSLEMGARNRVREFVTINRGTPGGGGTTRVGDDNLFMAYSHIAHDCTVGNRTIFANGATLAGHVEVGDDATVGAYSGVHQFCRVARFAFIGGYSVVTQDALPWVLTVGNRATSHGVNVVGLKRRGYPAEVVEAIKKTYMTLFRSRLLLDEAIARVESELGHLEEVRYFLDFVRTSKRGVCR